VTEASYKARQESYKEVSAKNADCKKVLDSMVEFRGNEYLWWQVAELSFDAFMVRIRARTADRVATVAQNRLALLKASGKMLDAMIVV
jgi:hypothetical protein